MVVRGFSSPSAELGGAFLEEGGRAFPLVLGGGAEAEVGSFEQQALALARVHSLVRCLERELDGDRSVRSDFPQNGLGARDQIGGRNDFVDQPDAIGLLRADHLSGQNKLQGKTLADQPRQTLRSAAARNESERDLGLAKLRAVHRDPDCAGHGRLAAAAERKAIDGRDHRLPRFSIRSRTSWPKRLDWAASNGATCASSLMSAPAMNALLPAPVRMTPRTALSSRAASKAVRRSFQVGAFRALSTLGRLTVT